MKQFPLFSYEMSYNKLNNKLKPQLVKSYPLLCYTFDHTQQSLRQSNFRHDIVIGIIHPNLFVMMTTAKTKR